MSDRQQPEHHEPNPSDVLAELEFKDGFATGKEWANYDAEEGQLDNLLEFRNSPKNAKQAAWDKFFDEGSAATPRFVAAIVVDGNLTSDSENVRDFWFDHCATPNPSNHFVRGFCEGALSEHWANNLRSEHAADLNGFAAGLAAGTYWATSLAYWGQVRDLLSWYGELPNKDRTDWSDLFDEVATVILWEALALEVDDEPDKDELRRFWSLIPYANFNSKLWLKGFCVGVSQVSRILKTLRDDHEEDEKDVSRSSDSANT